MHRSLATSTILEHELSEFRLLVERQTGLVLDCPNSVLAARLADFIEAQELDSPATLLERLRSPEQDPATLPSLLDGLVSANTGFFRHPGALNALTRQVLPQLWARKSVDSPGPIRIWSAGCATGEETYSIAMAVCDAVNPANVSVPNNGSASVNATGKGAKNGGIAENNPAGQPPARLGSGLLNPHRRQRPAAAKHRSGRPRRIPAVGAGGSAAGHDSQLFFENWYTERRSCSKP